MKPLDLDARHVAYLSLFIFMMAVLVITHSVAVLVIVAFLARLLYLSSIERSNAFILSPCRVGVESYVGEARNV